MLNPCEILWTWQTSRLRQALEHRPSRRYARYLVAERGPLGPLRGSDAQLPVQQWLRRVGERRHSLQSGTSLTRPNETMSREKPGYLTLRSVSRMICSSKGSIEVSICLPSVREQARLAEESPATAQSSEGLSQMARQNSDLFAILRDGSTCNRKTALGKHRHDILVAQRTT